MIMPHAVAAVLLAAQDAPPAPPVELPWPVALGFRVATLERERKVVDQVVLVPDSATYVAEIAQWTASTRWPVLFDEPRFAPSFIRAFKPARVIRRESVGAWPDARVDREALVRAATVAKSSNPTAGVVLTSMQDPAWTAAVALAAGRCQPITFLDGDFGDEFATLDANRFTELRTRVDAAAEASGVPWRGLGDAIETVTICRSIAVRCTPMLSPQLRLNVSGLPQPVRAEEPLSTMDCLARHENGVRWGVASWIFGPQDRSAFVAMSSMFLGPGETWLMSQYPDTQGWKAYAPQAAATRLAKTDITTRVVVGHEMSLDSWRRQLMGGFDCGMLWLNSHGQQWEFALENNVMANVNDVPLTDVPCALHCIHSFSLAQPANPESIGGRFIEQGIYCYHGSMFEPFLPAFVPPELLAERVAYLAPLLVSARVYEGPFALPWRTTGYGDPLHLAMIPQRYGVERIAPPDDGSVALRATAIAALQSLKSAPSDAAFASAMRDLVMIGEDALAISVWTMSQQAGDTKSTATDALGPLFRARDFNAFLEAFAASGTHRADDLTMLWHLAGARLGNMSGDEGKRAVALLSRNMRGPDVSADFALLAPALERLLGRQAMREAGERAAVNARDPAIAARIRSKL